MRPSVKRPIGDLTVRKLVVDEIQYAKPYWDDLNVHAQILEFAGNNDPTPVNFDIGGSGLVIKLYEFAKDDEAFFLIQNSHSNQVGAKAYAHLHWTAGEQATAESGNKFGWQIDLVYANIHGVFLADVITLDLSSECHGEASYHEITPDVDIKIDDLGISAYIVGRVYRSDTGTDDTWSGTGTGNLPLLLGVDLHIAIDSPGSRQIRVK